MFGIVVNIKMIGVMKMVSIESNALVCNNMPRPIKIYAKTPLQEFQDLKSD